jgi:hypothetical protein
MNTMQTQQVQLGDERNAAAYIREQHTTQLQDAVARYLPALYKRAYRCVGDPHDAEDALGSVQGNSKDDDLANHHRHE